MKKSILLWTKTTYVATFILFLLCLTFSCQQQVKEGLTEEEAKAFVERDLEIWNGGNLALADELYSPKFLYRPIDISEDIVGIDAFKELVKGVRTTYPDFNVKSKELIIKNDRIVNHWMTTGTNTGPLGELPPTNKKIQISGITIIKVVNGKIAEEWLFYNYAAIYRQLGFTITPLEEQSEQ
ncbi:hypothetical protein ES705_29578 [subsurface metagenome]